MKIRSSVAIMYTLLAAFAGFLFSAFVLSIAGVDQVVYEGASLHISGVLSVAAAVLVNRPNAVAFANPFVTVFRNDLERVLFPDNSFYSRSVDDTPFVVNGKTVQYPVQGINPNVEINRSTLPAQISQRTDDTNDYDLNEFTSDPTLITDTEELEINYNKRQSVLMQHSDTINTKLADFFANLWLPDGTDNIVRTTGATRVATAPGATGNRLKVTQTDLINVAEKLDRMNVPRDQRFALITPAMVADVMGIENFVSLEKIGTANLLDGTIGRLLGFTILVRNGVGIYDNTGTPVKKALGATAATTDNEAALFWHPRFVNRAKGEIKVYSDLDKPEYYGSIFSAMVRAGGKTRKDKKGIIALVQGQ
ncbi:MAG: hypothetical protein F9K23_00735 [Bacteroidetes bacterium]|nr:MAG: hypothetical protein F9K23_00735 [Bacteroidota bacterium]